MENEKHLSPTDFKLDSFQLAVLDVFYLSLKQTVTMSGAYFEVENFVVEKCCKKYELDFVEVLENCKRMVNVKNKED